GRTGRSLHSVISLITHAPCERYSVAGNSCPRSCLALQETRRRADVKNLRGGGGVRRVSCNLLLPVGNAMTRCGCLLLLFCAGCQGFGSALPHLAEVLPTERKVAPGDAKAEAALDPEFHLGQATALTEQGNNEAAEEH